MQRLTPENTNAREHRLTGDTLVYDCPNCEWGEVVITDMIEDEAGRCPDCGAAHALHAEETTTD